MLRIACAGALMGAIGAATAHGSSIGVHYGNYPASFGLIAPTPAGSPTPNTGEDAGFVDQYYWNNTQSLNSQSTDANSTTAGDSLVGAIDSNGNATTLGVSWANNGNNFEQANVVTSGTSITGDQELFEQYWRPLSGSLTLSITGVPTSYQTGYSLYVYYGLQATSRTGSITVAGTALGSAANNVSVLNTSYPGTTQTNGWTEGNNAVNSTGQGNYLVFNGLTDSGLTITDTGAIGIYGFELVGPETTVPEPLSGGILTMAGLALLSRRRRTRC